MTHELPTEHLPEVKAGQDAAHGEDAVLARIDLDRALECLSPVDRLLVRLHYEGDLTHAAVAAALGLSVANVKVRLHRLRPKLRETLQAP